MLEVADLIGIPFVEFGRDVNTGLDCYGLAIEVEKRLGKKLNDVVLEKFDYALEKFDYAKVKATLPGLNVKKTDVIKEGVILEFYGLRDKRLHVGVALDNNTFIHATENQGVRISTLTTCKQYLKFEQAYEVL